VKQLLHLGLEIQGFGGGLGAGHLDASPMKKVVVRKLGPAVPISSPATHQM